MFFFFPSFFFLVLFAFIYLRFYLHERENAHVPVCTHKHMSLGEEQRERVKTGLLAECGGQLDPGTWRS